MATREERVAGRASGPLGDLLAYWRLSLRATNKSEETCRTYVEAAAQFDE